MEDAEDIDSEAIESVGLRIRSQRKARSWTLDEMAERSGVSRAMLSKIERGETNPTLLVASRIARALGTGLSELAGETQRRRSGVVTRRQERVLFEDPSSGFVRALVSPPFENRSFELVEHRLPPGVSTGCLAPYPAGVEKQLVVEEGTLTAAVGSQNFTLQPGDGLFFDANVEHEFVCQGSGPCRYYLVVTSPRR